MRIAKLGGALILLTASVSCTPAYQPPNAEVPLAAVSFDANGALPPGVVGQAYHFQLAASGGYLPYTWAIASGTLPQGLTLGEKTGTLSGTPTEAGTFSVTVSVTDSSATAKSVTFTATLSVVSALDVPATALADGVVGVAYSATLASTGGATPVSWTVTGGALPKGLTLDSATGAIRGTPTRAGGYSFAVRAKEASPAAQTRVEVFSITVADTLVATAAALPDGVVGVAYSQKVVVAGGLPPYTFALTTGAPGVGALAAATGVLSGTPTTAGDTSVLVAVTDSASPAQTQTLTLALHVAEPLAFGAANAPDGVRDVAYSFLPAITGGTGDLNFRITAGALADGLFLDPTTGRILGSPAVTGSFTFTLRATDSGRPAQTATRVYTFNVGDSLQSTAGLPEGTVGVAYTGQLTGSGGIAPYTWTANASLGNGLSLAADGSVSGTPTSATPVIFTSTFRDSAVPPQTVTRSITIAVFPPLAITSTQLKDAVVGAAYSDTLAVTGGHGPYTYAVSSGSMPAGLALNASTGAITGTPTATASASLGITVTDSGNPVRTATATVGLQVRAPLVVTTASLQDGSVGAAYSQSVNVTGGNGPYTWAIVFGTLPNGLSFDTGTGAITGTPTAAGSSNSVQIRVTDSSAPAQVANATYNLAVYPALSLTTASLRDGVVGSAYSDTLAVSGGLGPFTFALTTGTLPNGLSLNGATGTLSGTPTGTSTTSLTFTVTDSANPARTATATLMLNVRAPLSITTAALQDGVVGAAYTDAVAATGGLAPYTFQVVTGTLPAGLTLNASTGAITGTPTAAASSNAISVRVTDSSVPAQTATASFNPGIYGALVVTNTALRDGVVGAVYSDALVSSGGKGPFTWSVTGTMPAGLTLNPATGAIAGTPAAVAAPSLTFQVTDSASPPRTASAVLTLNTRAALASATSTLVDGVVGTPYSDAVVVTGGLAPYNLTIAFSTLPPGLSLNATTGAVTGTPSAAASSTVQIQITDASTPAQTITRVVSVSTYPALDIGATPLKDAVVGAPYADGLTVTGGKAPYTWALTGGTMPAGLALNAATGAITGTPSAVVAPSLTFRVTDSANPARNTTRTFTLSVRPLLSITTAQLADGAVGQAYTSTVATTGGTAPLTFSIALGTLPRGLSLNASTGVISGTPTIGGSSTVQIRVTDSGSPAQVANATYNPNIRPQLQVLTTALTNAVRGTAYAFTLSATGGSAPYNFGTVSLPPGMSLNAVTGVLSGTPTTAGSQNVTFTLTDSAQPPQSVTTTLPLNVLPTLAFTTTALTPRVQNTAWTSPLAVTGGVAPYTFSVSGFLPAGVSLDTAQGILAGPATQVGSTPLTFIVTDSGSPAQRATVSLTQIIAGPLSLLPTALPAGRQSLAYGPVTILRQGGMPLASPTWSVTFGGLPTGITYNAGAGTLGGVPAVSGTFAVTATLNDSGPPAQGPITVNYTLDIASQLAVATTALPNAIRDVPYSATLASIGGSGAVTWSIVGGSLPAGLSLNGATGVISGTPTAAAGPLAVTFRASQAGPPTQTADSTGLSIAVRTPLAVTTATLPTLQRGVAMTPIAFAATGGVGPYTWVANPAGLPPGLSFTAGGVLSGTPTAATAGTAVTFQVGDPGTPAQTATATLTVRVRDTLSITSAAPPNGVVGRSYSHQFTSTGGVAPITWSVSSGSLPLGLTLNAATGLLSGTVSTPGTSLVTIRATDGAPDAVTATQSVTTLIFYPLLALPTKVLADGSTALTTYSDSIAASGGQGTYSYAVTGGALPKGVSLNPASGALTGYTPAPTKPGSFTFQVTVTDGASPPQTAATLYSIFIGQETLVASWAAVVDVPYNVAMAPFVLTLNGGTPSYTYSLVGPDPMPPGLVQTNWNLAPTTTTASITGTATVDPGAGAHQDYPLSIQVLDQSPSPVTITRSFTVRVHHMDITPTTWAVDGVSTQAFPATTVSARENIGAVTWSISSGALPDGLSIGATTGQIAGTITGAPGTYNFTVRAVDAAGQQFDQPYTMNVYAAMAITQPQFPDAYEGQDYGALALNFDTITTGGNPPYFVNVVNGSPVSGATPFADPTTGIGITFNGAVTGTISATAGGTGSTQSTTYSYAVTRGDSAAPQQTVSRTLTLTVYRALQFANATLPDAVRGAPYPQTGTVSLLPSVTFGKPFANPVQPYNFTAQTDINGSGLNLSTNGTLSGTLSAGFAGDLAFSATVTDALGQVRTANFNLHVADPIFITNASPLPQGEVTFGYSLALAASGGTGAVAWSQVAGVLPAGLSLGSGGLLAGTPTVAGTYVFDVRATDQGTPAQTTVRTFTMVVNDRLTITTTAAQVPDSINGVPYNFQLVSANGTGTVTWTITAGGLPPGLTLNPSGSITGTPTAAGNTTVTFTATDSLTAAPGGGPATATLTVNPFYCVEPIQLTVTQNLRGARENYYDGTTVTASGGRGAYTIVLDSGALPDGTALVQTGASADILGLLATTGQTTAVLRVTDTGSPAQTVTQSVTVNVDPPMYLTSFVDISSAVAPQSFSGVSCDDGYWTIGLPYTFRYHDQGYTTAHVSTNGLVGFVEAGIAAFNNSGYGGPSLPNGMIAGRWEDLYFCGGSGSVHIGTFGQAPHRFTIVQYKDVGFYADLGLPANERAKINFEVVLYETSNAVQMLYAPSTNGNTINRNTGNLARVGLERQNGTATPTYTPSNVLSSGLILTYGRQTATSYAVTDVRANQAGAFKGIRNTGGATALNTTTMGNDASINVALPFSFPFYGAGPTPPTSYANVSISPNGGMVLSNSATAVALPPGNLQLTNPALPGPVIAPFWDDLTVQASQAPLAWVGYQTFGTAPFRRFVVEWSNVALVGDNLSRLSFEATLFETTGRVEFAYGLLLAQPANAAAAAGGLATVGIATPTGPQRGVELMYNWSSGGTIDPALAGGLAQGDVVEFLPTDRTMVDYRREVVSDNFTEIVNNGQGKLTSDPAVCNGTCVDLSSAVNAYSNVNLGFTFNSFGQALTAVTVNTNGVLVPENSRTAAGDVGTVNQVLGTTAAPNNLIAPFWENLDPLLSGGDIQVLTQGTAGSRRFITQWHNLAVKTDANADTGARITFEAVLSEGSNEVEFIYGNSNGGLALGNSSTVGIEGPGGTSVFSLLNNTPGPGPGLIFPGLSFRMKP